VAETSKKLDVASGDDQMSKERLMQWIALAANGGTIIGLLMVIMQLQQNRTLMRAQVRRELASTIVDLLNTTAGKVRTLYSPLFASEIDGLQPPEPVKRPSPIHP
jgi:hypothetical protein